MSSHENMEWWPQEQPVDSKRHYTSGTVRNQTDKCLNLLQCAVTRCHSGISQIGISTLSSEKVRTTSPQVHHCLKRFSVAHFTPIRIVTLTRLSGMPVMTQYGDYPGSNSK